jgi:hypothetical protein
MSNVFEELVAGIHSSSGVEFSEPAMAAALDERKKKQAEQLTAACLAVVDESLETLKSEVLSLRSIRADEKHQEKHVKLLDAAVRYFGQSGNPFPYFKAIGQDYRAADICARNGVDVPGKDSELWKVPGEPGSAPEGEDDE